MVASAQMHKRKLWLMEKSKVESTKSSKAIKALFRTMRDCTQMQRCRAVLRNPTRFPWKDRSKSFCYVQPHHLFDEILQTSPTPKITTSNPLESIRDRLRSCQVLDPNTVATALKSSRGTTGCQIHKLAISLSLDSYVFVSNSLMNMYAKSGSFDLACKVFADILNPDVVSWNTILSGFTCAGEALEFLVRMHRAGVPLDAVTFTVALSFSSDLEDLEYRLQLHCLAVKSAFASDTFVGNALITAYSTSGSLEESRRVFDEMAVRDTVSWNALISGLTQEGGYGAEAIRVFLRMLAQGVRADHVSLASVISACCQEGSVELGTQIHGLAVKVGLETHVSVSNVVMSLYYKHGCIGRAKAVFRNIREGNVISWTTMISIDMDNSVRLFNQMRSHDVRPNDVTFVALIYAVSNEREGQMIHGICLSFGISGQVNVANSLITMYAQLGCVTDSRKLFQGMDNKEIISWNALISGYAHNGLCEEALEAFSTLLLQAKPNQYTFGSVLGAITVEQTVSLRYGQKCHSRIVKSGLNTDEYVSGALIDLYAKRGSIGESQRVFDEASQRSLVSWTAIISAHAKHGNYETVMDLFQGMVNDTAVRPDHITFLAVLTACGCKGMFDTGRRVFDSMISEHNVEPWPEHYACMVDMLGRAGRFAEAEEFVKRMPKAPGLSALQSLLGACRVHGNLKMGERVAETLMEMEPMESGAYVLISNLYAEKGEWENVAKIRRGMRNRGVKKEVGFSWVDIGIGDSLHMHKFSSDDKTHPLSAEIYTTAASLAFEMRTQEESRLP